jgi:hypothetical protein
MLRTMHVSRRFFLPNLWSMARGAKPSSELEKRNACQVPRRLGFPCAGVGVSGAESCVRV